MVKYINKKNKRNKNKLKTKPSIPYRDNYYPGNSPLGGWGAFMNYGKENCILVNRVGKPQLDI